MNHPKLKDSLWPQTLDALRQVTPWLDLTFHEFLVLENILSQSVRRMSLVGDWQAETLSKLTGGSVKSVAGALRKIKKVSILQPTDNPGQHAVNCYGLVSHYLRLCDGSRPIRKTKIQQLEELVQELSIEWNDLGLPLLSIDVTIAKMTARAEKKAPLYSGSRKPQPGYLKTNAKLSILAACMELALRKLSIFSELAVFMRILDMTLGRGKFREDFFTGNYIQYGHEGFGTIGVPVSRRRVQLALKSLNDRSFIRITKESRTSQVFSILLNTPGITALNARESDTWEAKSVFWMTKALHDEAYMSNILKIDGHKVLDLTEELRQDRGILVGELFSALGSDEASVKTSAKWITGSCPLAEWTHSGRTDENPSFGISIDTSGDIFFHCFTCSPKSHPIWDLIRQLEKLSGEFPTDAAALAQIIKFSDSTSEIHQFRVEKQPILQTTETVPPIPDSYLEKFPLLHKADLSHDIQAIKCRDYLLHRGISLAACEYLNVRYVPGYLAPLLIFPYTSDQGKVFVLRARNVDKKGGFFIWNEKLDTEINDFRFPRLSESRAWFGLEKIDPSRPVTLVEGECDALKLITLGHTNVIASGGVNLTQTQSQVITDFQQIILGFDSDEAGQAANIKVADLCSNLKGSPKSPPPTIKVANWSLARRKDGLPCKDPGDLEDDQGLALVMANLEEVK